jgi:hypothetical protein
VISDVCKKVVIVNVWPLAAHVIDAPGVVKFWPQLL